MRAAVALFVLSLAACRARAPEPSPSLLVAKDAADPLRAVAAEEMPRPLRLGLIPVFRPNEMVEAYAPLAAYLGSELGTVVEVTIDESYEKMVERVAAGGVEVVQLSPLAYVWAKAEAPALDLLATNISDGSSTYSGFLLVRSDSGIDTLEALRGKKIGFVDERSASGYLYAYAFFLDHGIDPSQFFSAQAMTGRHDLVVSGLVEGKFDVAATFAGALYNAEKNGTNIDNLEIIAKTGRIPYDAWCARGDLPASVRLRIQNALLALSSRTREGREKLAPLQSINAFTRTEDSAYDEIRHVKKTVEEATD